jgi:hypothetical protein
LNAFLLAFEPSILWTPNSRHSPFGDLADLRQTSHTFQFQEYMKMKFTVAALLIGSAAAYSPSSFSGSALKASANDATMKMEATGMGVNGFGRIGRLGK